MCSLYMGRSSRQRECTCVRMKQQKGTYAGEQYDATMNNPLSRKNKSSVSHCIVLHSTLRRISHAFSEYDLKATQLMVINPLIRYVFQYFSSAARHMKKHMGPYNDLRVHNLYLCPYFR
jgi:hypothetical protein